MARNRLILFVLVLVLAASSFGFVTSQSALGVPFNDKLPGCPEGYVLAKIPVQFDGHTIWRPGCKRVDYGVVNNNTDLIQNSLALVKVNPQLASALALFEQPTGTVVTNVSGLYVGTVPPYYDVTIVNGNYVKDICVNAWNGSFLGYCPSHPAPLPGVIFFKGPPPCQGFNDSGPLPGKTDC
ncbi:MAG: hypothetical protein P4L50_18050 [Anaerolineaceae bacterium]|nr:hypothetical protein [Anaerolineaceae bacterium]